MDWAQILGAGGLNDQQGQIDQQLADLIARRRSYQPQQHSTGAGALLGGIGDIIRERNFNNQEQGLRTQRQDLSRQTGERRAAYIDELLGAQKPVQAPPDLIAAPGMDQASQEKDRQQKLRGLQTAGMLSGDPLMSQYAQHAPAMAMQEENLKKTRLEQLMEQLKIDQAGPQADLGGQTPNTFHLLTERKKASQVGINPITGLPYAKTGGPGATPAPGPNTPAPFDKRLAPMQKAFAQDFDQNAARAGLPKENQGRINAAERIYALALSKDPTTGAEVVNDLNPQQMTELATSSAALLSNGGGDAATRHELTPYTHGRTTAQLAQWLTDSPHGAGQQAFVKSMVDMARREQAQAHEQIRGAQQQRLANHLSYFNTFPEEAKAQMQAYGWDPSEVDMKSGKYTPKAKAAPSGTTDLRKKYGL